MKTFSKKKKKKKRQGPTDLSVSVLLSQHQRVEQSEKPLNYNALLGTVT